MAKITRVTQKTFGLAGSVGNFGKFGSKAAGAAVYTQDPAVIQALAAFTSEGWADAVVDGNVPELEDMNGLFLLAFYQLAYQLQEGVAEWDAGTTYYTNSIAKYNGVLYISLQDTNLNQQPDTATSYWDTVIGSKGVQPGVIQSYAGAAAPTGYLICDGSAISRSTYAALFAVCGTTYGSGNGTTTFNIPDLRTRVPVGYKSADDTFGTLGLTPGAKTVNLQHNHAGKTGGVIFNEGGGELTAGALDTYHDHPINNDLSTVQSIVQPSIVINYIIKT